MVKEFTNGLMGGRIKEAMLMTKKKASEFTLILTVANILASGQKEYNLDKVHLHHHQE